MYLVDWIGTCGMWKQSREPNRYFFFSFHFPRMEEGENVRYEIFQCNSGKKGFTHSAVLVMVRPRKFYFTDFARLKLCTRTITTHLFNSFPLSFESF